MRRPAQLAGKETKVGNEAQPITKKKRSNEKTSKIATLDNGTMVEAFKYLNYCQLAKKSLVSKRFRDLIQTHRHKLALLSVHRIGISINSIGREPIKIFDKELSPDAYNDWVICNNYSKQVSFEDQVAGKQNTQSDFSGYLLRADAHYKDPNHGNLNDSTCVFSALVRLNCNNWPLFQHFVRLATDPFIYIDNMNLTPQTDVLNSLAEVINSERRLQCSELSFYLNGSSHKSITWAKNHVRCKKFYIYGETDVKQDESFLDFFLTGAQCTPSIKGGHRVLSNAMINFVQKFMDLKTSDKCQLVEAIEGNFQSENTELLNSDYAEFLVSEDRDDDDDITEQIFELINNNIGKKMQLTVEYYGYLQFFGFSIKLLQHFD